MTLNSPYYVYGTITDAGAPVNGASVYVQDTTGVSSILNILTNAQGKYMIDLKSIANNGDTIKTWSFSGGKYNDDSFTLNVFGPHQIIDLAIGYPSLTDTFSIIDSHLKDASGVFTDTFNIIDSLSDLFESPLSDSLGMTDGYSFLFGYPPSDSLLFTDGYIKEVSDVFSDTIGMTDGYIKNVSHVFFDNLSMIDSYIKHFYSYHSDSLLSNDIMSYIIHYYRYYFDNVSIVESFFDFQIPSFIYLISSSEQKVDLDKADEQIYRILRREYRGVD